MTNEANRKSGMNMFITKFNLAWGEFIDLPGVNSDPLTQTTIADLIFAAQFEVDHFEEGESELTSADIAKIKKFLHTWGREEGNTAQRPQMGLDDGPANSIVHLQKRERRKPLTVEEFDAKYPDDKPGARTPPYEALEALMGMIESGVLVRDTSRDSEPGWAMRQVELLRVLANANDLLGKKPLA